MGYAMSVIKMNLNKYLKISYLILLIAICGGLTSCTKAVENDKINIVTTNFVQYSITKEIVGTSCNVKMVLRPGQNSHNFDPTINSVIEMNRADLFIYTSSNIETWALKIISKWKEDGPNIIESSKGIELKATIHEHEEDHQHEEEEEHEGHDHAFDPHVWTSIKNAIIMTQNIANGIISLDPDNQKLYSDNSQSFINRLKELESEYRLFFDSIESPKIYFVSPFSFLYMCDEYKIDYFSLYATCSTEVEPSATDLINMINEIKANNVKYIYTKELVSSEVADKIAEVTNTKVLLLHSADNVSMDDFKKGITYYDIMKSNLTSLKKGIK